MVPLPISWLRAIATALLLAFFVVCLRATGFLGLMLSMWQDNLTPLLVMLPLAWLLPFLVVVYAHHILFGKTHPKRPDWMPSYSSFKEGANALIVMAVCTLVAGLILVSITECYFYKNDLNCISPTEDQYQFVSCVWLILAAYLYQYDFFWYVVIALIADWKNKKQSNTIRYRVSVPLPIYTSSKHRDSEPPALTKLMQ